VTGKNRRLKPLSKDDPPPQSKEDERVASYGTRLAQPEIAGRTLVGFVTDSAHAAGRPGKYTATLILGIPGLHWFHETTVDMNEILASGDSPLGPRAATGLPTLRLSKDEPYSSVEFRTNAAGYLAEAVVEVEARDVDDAEVKAHDIVLPMLSWLSFFYTIPADVSTFKIVEETTGSQWLAVNMLGQRKRAYDPINVRLVDPALRLLLASYREGMITTNPFYQLLCFWKVTEGVRQRRAELGERAKANNQQFGRPKERLPTASQEIPGFPATGSTLEPYLGRSFVDALDKGLQDAYRHAIAHLDPTRSVLSIDRTSDMQVCEQAVPLVRYMSHEMLLHELEAAPIWERSAAGYTFVEWIDHVLTTLASMSQRRESAEYVTPQDVIASMGDLALMPGLATAVTDAFYHLEGFNMVENKRPITNPPSVRLTSLGHEAVATSIAAVLDLPGRWRFLAPEQQRFLRALRLRNAQISRATDRYPSLFRFIPIGEVFVEMQGSWDAARDGAAAKELALSLTAKRLSGFQPDEAAVANVLPRYEGLWCVEHAGEQ
jgi:hypothetical protein